MTNRNKQWKKLQELVAKDVYGEEALQSGAQPGYKYDVFGSRLYIECKSRAKGDRVQVDWFTKLEKTWALDGWSQEGIATAIPCLIVADTKNIKNYMAFVHTKAIDLLKDNDLEPPFLYGYPDYLDPLLLVVEEGDRSIRIKGPEQKDYFFNFVSLPQTGMHTRQYFLVDRKEFKFMADKLNTLVPTDLTPPEPKESKIIVEGGVKRTESGIIIP